VNQLGCGIEKGDARNRDELDIVSRCRIDKGWAVAQKGAQRSGNNGVHFGSHRKVSVHTSHEALTVAHDAREGASAKRFGVAAAKRPPD
jgi:hypothetical protein